MDIVSVHNALIKLDELKVSNLQVLGVDLYYVYSDKLVQDYRSLDLSDITDVNASIEIARDFLLNRLPSAPNKIEFVQLVY